MQTRHSGAHCVWSARGSPVPPDARVEPQGFPPRARDVAEQGTAAELAETRCPLAPLAGTPRQATDASRTAANVARTASITACWSE